MHVTYCYATTIRQDMLVLPVTAGELRRTPASDGFTHKLLRGNKKSETHKHDNGVLAADAVHVVIVLLKFHLANAKYRFKQAIHRKTI